MKLNKKVFVGALLVLCVFCMVGILYAAENIGPIPMNELLEKAKAEGTVTFYYSTPTREGDAILDGFRKKYPFMKAEGYRQPSYKLWEKYKAEYRGNKKIADVMFCGGAAMVENIRYMDAYITSEDKNFDHKDSQNRWIAVRSFTASMMVNRNFIKGADVPKDWLDFINPRPSWRGKIGIGDIHSLSYTYNTVYGLYKTFGLETLKKIFAGWKKSEPKIIMAATTATEAAITGEIPIVADVLMDRWVEYAVERKAPLDWIYPTSGMIVYNMVAGMLKDEAHPYAGRLLLTYLLSDDCQKILSNMGYYVWRKGITPPSYLKPLNTVKTINVFDEEVGEAMRPELVALWESYFSK
jgi:iron(III) transport system substrate-binding protein